VENPRQRTTIMSRPRLMFAVLMLLAVAGAGCGASIAAEETAVPGRRVQGTQVSAEGAVPYQVGAYELVFAEPPQASSQTRRAALLVDLVGGQGHVRGFVEWGRAERPTMYAASGWARQRTVDGELVTVVELILHYLEPRGTRRAARDPQDPADLALRVAINEASGDVTLIRRR
jgi:hypothetical protein